MSKRADQRLLRRVWKEEVAPVLPRWLAEECRERLTFRIAETPQD